MTVRAFDTYDRYEELTARITSVVSANSHLFRLESLGRSHEGRELWVVTATNFSTGPDHEKPALWLDANIHSREVTGSMACLYFIQWLADNYDNDDAIKRCLDSRAFYIVPRVNPDGTELALSDVPTFVRSSTRPYPLGDGVTDGFFEEDIDADGRILSMRVPDHNGAWKAHPEHQRLMIRRGPDDVGGQYYRILPEGRLYNVDSTTIQVRPPKEGLDLNRNFPMSWRPESDQPGAGPYPASEPETRALMDFVAHHPNLIGSVSLHTYSGVILRPYDDRPDDEFPVEDLWTYRKLGDMGTQLTGWPNISVYHEFRPNPQKFSTGAFDAWMYESMGVFAWTVELWCPIREAGITEYQYADWFREHPVEDDLKLLRWSDDVLDGNGYVDWYPYEHPELGSVELGGWDAFHSWYNPPGDLLEKEVSRLPEWLIWHLNASPSLGIRSTTLEAIGEGLYRVALVVENTGWLPTYVTKKALEKSLTRGVSCAIELDGEASLQAGVMSLDCGELEGRAYTLAADIEKTQGSTTDRASVEWVVSAPVGAVLKVSAHHARAGTVRATLVVQ